MRQNHFGSMVEGHAVRAAPYAIGVLAAFWFFARLADL